jgi:hypothetical protein
VERVDAGGGEMVAESQPSSPTVDSTLLFTIYQYYQKGRPMRVKPLEVGRPKLAARGRVPSELTRREMGCKFYRGKKEVLKGPAIEPGPNIEHRADLTKQPIMCSINSVMPFMHTFNSGICHSVFFQFRLTLSKLFFFWRSELLQNISPAFKILQPWSIQRNNPE